VIKNGIDTAGFAYDEQKRAEIRSMYGIDDDTVLIGTVGRLTYEKNQLYMLRLLRKLSSELSRSDNADDSERIRTAMVAEPTCGVKSAQKYMLLFAGGGEDLEMLQTYAMMMDLQDRVIFAGVSGRMNDFYSAMDVLAVPSEYEGFPLVVLEAQAAGLEVIASEAVPRIAQETGQVRIIPLEDRAGWIAALTSEHHRHSGTARKLEESGYSADKTAEVLRSLYLQN
jgi:glycosyltransferase involved in cell wall biosynthesis